MNSQSLGIKCGTCGEYSCGLSIVNKKPYIGTSKTYREYVQ